MRRIGLIVAAVTMVTVAWGQANVLPNGDFERGQDGPEGWTLSAMPGDWNLKGLGDSGCVSVTGSGQDSNYWRTDQAQFAPGQTYECSTWIRTEPGSGPGSIITGPNFANYDFRSVEEWTQRRFVFRAPNETTDPYVRFGQWHFAGTALFDEVAIRPAQPINRSFGAIELGDGEAIEGDRYLFNSQMGGYRGNYSRPLQRLTAHFNTHRWVFFPGAEVVYRHAIADASHTSASVTVSVGWYAAGSCIVEASADAENWVEIGSIGEKTEKTFDLPAELLPAAEVFVRLSSPGEGERADSAPGSFQVYSYSFAATLDRDLGSMQGSTSFMVVTGTDDRLAVDVGSLGGLLPGRDNVVRMTLRNPGGAPLTVAPRLELEPEDGAPATIEQAVTVPAGGQAEVEIPYLADQIGPWTGVVRVLLGAESLFAAEFSFAVPELFRSNFGYAIESDAAMDLWWCEGTYKVNRDRPAPVAEARVVKLEAARGEFEPAQIVLRPKQALTKLTGVPSDLTGPGGAQISAQNIDLLAVNYVNVWRPTDFQGCEGWWPDPLPMLDDPIDLAAGENQPLWLRVFVPRDARPGEYTGTVTLRADGWGANVPVSLRVFDFEIPDKHSMLATMGFGLRALHG